jgi:ribosomal protein L37AE/L43A
MEIGNKLAAPLLPQDKTWEVTIMPTTFTSSTHRPGHKMTCVQCGDGVIAPEFVEYFSEGGLILKFWSCNKCGYQFETESFAPANAKPKIVREELEEDWSALL